MTPGPYRPNIDLSEEKSSEEVMSEAELIAFLSFIVFVLILIIFV